MYPGGVREAIFANDQYSLEWNKRVGFAKVALAAKVVSGDFNFWGRPKSIMSSIILSG